MADTDRARPPWADQLAAALAEPARVSELVALRPGLGGRRAAVLVVISEGPAGPEIVFVERAATLRNHPGQIAFPGGAADPGDADLAATALREAYEEIGVEPAQIDVLGAIPAAHVAVSGFDVHAVVGWWRTPSAVTVVDAGEVASVIVVPVTDLVEPAHRARVQHPSGFTGPGFEVAGHLIWGLTAHLLDGVLELAGWQRPWDETRAVAIPARYLTDRSLGGRADAH